MVSVNIFFPNNQVLERMQTKRKIITLEVFVTIETYLNEVQRSLQTFEKYNKDYDEYCAIIRPTDKLQKNCVFNWFAKYNSIKKKFEEVKYKCQIDQLLLDQQNQFDDEIEDENDIFYSQIM